MIRPFTCLAMLMAAGSGLYLYQAKHQAYVLDREIDQVVRSTSKIREHVGVLRAEYALLNDPSRLQELANAHLPALVPMAPGQFTTLAQLDSRLPPMGAPPAPPPAAAPAEADPLIVTVPTGHAPYDYPPAPTASPAPVRAAEPHAPARSAPVAAPALVASAAAPEPVASTRPSVQARPAEQPTSVPRRVRPVIYAHASRPQPRRAMAFAAPRPDPLAIPAAASGATSAPRMGGSVLGMARTLVAPATATYYQRYQPGAAETLGR